MDERWRVIFFATWLQEWIAIRATFPNEEEAKRYMAFGPGKYVVCRQSVFDVYMALLEK